MKALTEYLFSTYHVIKITWGTLLEKLPVNYISNLSIEYSRIEDNIASLPATYTDYLNSLGHQTKKHEKYYVGRMVRDFPSVEYIYKKGADITEEEFNTVCRYITERMAYKSKSYGGSRG